MPHGEHSISTLRGCADLADGLSPSPQRVWVIKKAIVAESLSVVSVELVHIDDPLNHTERGAIAGFLAGYTDNTLASHTTDLRLFVEWRNENNTPFLDVRRAHLEIFGRTMEANGRMRSTAPPPSSPHSSPGQHAPHDKLGPGGSKLIPPGSAGNVRGLSGYQPARSVRPGPGVGGQGQRVRFRCECLCQELVVCAGLLRRKLLAQTAESWHKPSRARPVRSRQVDFCPLETSFWVWREREAGSA
jgi:hypothetical protein